MQTCAAWRTVRCFIKSLLRFVGAVALFAAAIPSTLQAQSNVVLTLKMSTNGLTGWQTVHTVVTNMPAFPQSFYRMEIVMTNGAPPPSTNSMSLIPAGTFEMGDKVGLVVGGDGSIRELPVHTVDVSAFYMDKYEVTKALWDEVRAWGLTNGYTDLPAGSGKAANHPVHTISWYDMVKWSNARSQKEGLTPCYSVSSAVYQTGTSDDVVLNMGASGYRLPTEAEWEKAARGGLSGKRFPWGDTINHSYANYYNEDYPYESPQGEGHHPSYATGGLPYSSPVGSFAPNGHGLYDMAGNIYELCWDWYSSDYYASSPSSDPSGATSGSFRVMRGGSWERNHPCRVASRSGIIPGNIGNSLGFRCVRR